MRIERRVFGQLEGDIILPAEVITHFEAFAERVIGRSSIIWGEHCSECALPACYSNCSYYTPRADLTCMRFVAGIEPVATTQRVSLHRIRFRKWGKLEGPGPIEVRPLAKARTADLFDAAVSTLVETIPQPFRIKRNITWRWNSQRKRPFSKVLSVDRHIFVVESWAADGLTHSFTVTFLGKDGQSIYQERFEITSKYGRIEIPAQRIMRNVDLRSNYLVQIEPSGESAGSDIVLGFADFVIVRDTPVDKQTQPAPAEKKAAKRAKVIIWDLDNTVWDGILGEDGIDGIRLRTEIAEVIVELDRRGILHSIASKNDSSAAMEALERFKLAEYFLCPQIGWQPKSESVGQIAQSLDLGVDSFVFVDDQAFERGEVQEAHPTITVMSEEMATTLPAHSMCDVSVTAESKSRRSMYQAEALRSATFQASKTNYIDFLKSCGIVLEVTTLSSGDCERIYELSQRTNQLNFCGTKYTREDVNRLRSGELGVRTFVLRCSDRFGEYGVIGFAVVDVSAGLLIDFFMSCRVQRKHVENAFFATLGRLLRREGQALMSARVRKTSRNGASFQMLEELEFRASSEPELWVRDLSLEFSHSDTVRVELDSESHASGPADRIRSAQLECSS